MAESPPREPTPEELVQFAESLARPSGELGAKVAAWMETGNAPLVRSAQDALDARPGEMVVEVGPGSGVLSEAMARALGPNGVLHLVEHAPDMAQAAAQNLSGPGLPPVRVHVGDWTDAQISAEGVDGVIAVNVVYFVADLSGFMKACSGWLRPGGRLVLGIRSLTFMKSIPVTKHRFILRPLDDYFLALDDAGFEHITARYHPEAPMEQAGEAVALDGIVLHARRG
ncbi:MAG: methyltransferase domain-containing protein [Myxococcota bacterium]